MSLVARRSKNRRVEESFTKGQEVIHERRLFAGYDGKYFRRKMERFSTTILPSINGSYPDA